MTKADFAKGLVARYDINTIERTQSKSFRIVDKMSKPYILCVDDDKSILVSLKFQLQSALGNTFQIETAQSAQEAWEVIEDIIQDKQQVAAVISDYIMPAVKGDEFLKHVHATLPNTIKIMLTGHADQKAVESLFEEISLSGCFGKPWDIDEIVKTLRNALNINQEI